MRGKTIGKFLAILLTATMVVGVSVSCSSEKSTTGKKQTETTEKSDKKADKKKTDVTGKKEVKNDKLKNDKESDTKSDQKVENVKVETNKDNNDNKSDKNDNDSKKNNSNKNDSNKNDKPSTPSKSDNNGNTNNKPSKPDNNGNFNNKPSKPDNGGQAEKPQHKHSYSASVTKQPTCSSTGTRTYTCSCGDSYTESIPAVDHHWQHHDATGHYDKVVDQPAWDEPIYETRAICYGCGAQFKTADEAGEHTMMHFGDGCDSYYVDDVQTGTIHHEATYKDVWVQDSPAYDECTNCGARK